MSEGPIVKWVCKCGKNPERDCAGFLSCEEKILYQDGIRVYMSDLTLEELKKWYPTIYERRVGPPDINCPVCNKAFPNNGWRNLMAHTKAAHPEWYAENRDRMVEAGSAPEFLNAYADKLTVDHAVSGSPAQ